MRRAPSWHGQHVDEEKPKNRSLLSGSEQRAPILLKNSHKFLPRLCHLLDDNVILLGLDFTCRGRVPVKEPSLQPYRTTGCDISFIFIYIYILCAEIAPVEPIHLHPFLVPYVHLSPPTPTSSLAPSLRQVETPVECVH